jgi:DNA polymerase-1
VHTLLGRGSPLPTGAWAQRGPDLGEPAQVAGSREDADRHRRSWGRFTRNFVVQGTAAEWALCWLGGIRGRLAAAFDGPFPEAVPHLVFFLHDEVIVHAPEEDAARVAEIIAEAAADAGRLLFGQRPAVVPLSCSIVTDYAAAK